MKLAVLMSTYNGERYIRQQIDSVLAQQCSCQIDLIVRDDGSSDSTHAILCEYADAGLLQWYSGENLRSAKSFLDLLKHCPGYDFYAFADQDDHWYPEKLQKGLTLLQDVQGPGMCFANARLVDSALQGLGRNVYNHVPRTDFFSLVCSGGILGCTMVFNRQLAQLLQDAPAPEHLIMHDAYTAIVCAMHDGVIRYIPEPQMDYRQHSSNVVGCNWSKRDALRDRFRQITTPNRPSIAQQASSLIRCYPQLSDAKKARFLRRVANYPGSFFSALWLSLSRLPKYPSLNMAVTSRLAILFRNR